MDPIQFLGVMQQELEHQRQLMELMQQMQQQMRQMQHQEQQAHEAQTQQGAPPSDGNERQSQELIMKGFDKIEVFSGGEEQWQNWSLKIKTAVSGMNEEFAEMLTTAETEGMEGIEEVLREAKFVDANRERCVKAGKEMYGVLARYTNSEALTIVKSVSEMDGVRAWARLHANYSRRTLGRMFRVQRECMYPKPLKDVGQVRLAIMQWEEKWKVMMSELGEGAKIPDLWRMSALLEICPKDVKEQMLLRLDEVGENYENLKVKVISYTSNKAEQSRGQKETAVPMELDYVSGSEMYDEEEWDDVDEVRRGRRCHNCGMMGHFARDCRTKGKGKGKGKEEGKGYGKGKGRTMKGTGRKGAGKSGRFKGGRGEQNDRGYQGQCWSCGKIGHKSSECRWGVDNVDDDDDEVDGYSSGRRSGDRSESEKGSDVSGVWIVGNVGEIEDEEVSDVFSEDGADQRDGSIKIRADQRDGFSKIPVDQGDEFEFYSRRRMCKCQEETGETKRVNRRNRFLALTAAESDDDEEVNAIETVQKVVEITVDSGAAKSVWPSRKKGVERTKSKKAVKLAAANGSPIRVEGDARLEFIRDGMKCSMKFLDADDKRPLASVSAIVDEGNVVVFGQHESFIENVSTGQRIPMCRRNGVFVMRLDTQPCEKTSKSVRFNGEGVIERMSGFTRLA